MSSVECLREFMSERLTSAAEEIFRVFQRTIVDYEVEIDRQRRLLDIVWKPEIKLHRTELPQQHVCKEEEVLADQQFCDQERNCSLDQEDPEPPQIKEEQEELYTSLKVEELVLKQETETFMLIPTCEESDNGEDQTLDWSPDETESATEKEHVVSMLVKSLVVPEPNSDDQLLSHNSHVAESQDHKGGKQGDSGSTGNVETKPQKRHHNSNSHTNDPEPPEIKEEQEELYTSLEVEELVLKQETETFMLTPTCEESDNGEDQTLDWSPDETESATEKEHVVSISVKSLVVPEPNSDDQLLSYNSHVAESQDHKGGKQGDSGSTGNAETKPQKRHHNSNSHTNDPEPPQIKEEQEELYTSLEVEELVLKQETETFMLTPTCEESDNGEDQTLDWSPDETESATEKEHVVSMSVKSSVVPNSDDWLLSHISHVAESQDHKGGKQVDSGSTSNTEPKRQKRHRKSKSHSNNVCNTTMSKFQTHKGKKILKCDTCGKAFKYISQLNRHLTIHTDEKPYSCNSCEKRFSVPGALTLHMKVHTGEKPYPCNTCGRRFTQMAKVKRHMRTHTGEKPYPCNSCEKRFSELCALKVHMRVHTGEKPYPCNTCEKKFCDLGALKRHMRVHTGEKPYPCNTCEKKFSHLCALQKHMRIHTGEKPYPCNTCEKSFSQLGALKVHMRIHTGEKPYTCNTCEKRFSQLIVLQTHMRVHTGEKPYPCNTCEKRFSQLGALKVHMRVHTGEKPYTCNTCEKSFGDMGALKRHTRVHTGEMLYNCKTCERGFMRRNQLKIHMRTHKRDRTLSDVRLGKRHKNSSR